VLAVLAAAVAGLGAGALLADDGDQAPVVRGPDGVITPTPGATPDPPRGSVTAVASSTSVEAGERLTLEGELADGDEGLRVVVQRREDGEWRDFPASTTTGEGGTYDLEIALGRPGENLVRVSVPDTGAVSEPVPVRVG
jgi:hypothetical protein